MNTKATAHRWAKPQPHMSFYTYWNQGGAFDGIVNVWRLSSHAVATSICTYWSFVSFAIHLLHRQFNSIVNSCEKLTQAFTWPVTFTFTYNWSFSAFRGGAEECRFKIRPHWLHFSDLEAIHSYFTCSLNFQLILLWMLNAWINFQGASSNNNTKIFQSEPKLWIDYLTKPSLLQSHTAFLAKNIKKRQSDIPFTVDF